MRATRREALAAGALALAGLAGCGRGAPAVTGSTIHSTWIDPGGIGVLSRGPGEPLLARTELGPARPAQRVLATLVHLTDAHVLDASSPARVPFLDRLGPPFQSTFRPQEALTLAVLAGAMRSVRAVRADAVIQGGDLIDNAQANELHWALGALRGGRVTPEPYVGVQLPGDADPFYYRPDLDAPRHPGLLRAASRPLHSPGLGAPWLPVLGDHDILVQGELPPDATTQALATGSRALWELPAGLSVPPGTPLTAGGSPDGPPLPGAVRSLVAQALAGPTVRVPARASRRELEATEVVRALRPGARTLDYSADIGAHVRVIVLDLARRGGGSGGLVRPDQPGWLASQLRAAASAGRWVIAVSHQPLANSAGGEALLAELDRAPHVLAALAGHTHHNRIAPRAHYWLIETSSLIDHPQQCRTLQVITTAGGGVALRTWMLDHTGGELAGIARALAYLDAQGGRPGGFAGTPGDRNAVLYRAS